MDPVVPLVSTQPPARKRPLIIGVIAGVIVLLIIIGSIIAITSKATTSKGAILKPSFPNQLTPTSELKIGSYRYVSPCQALPTATVTNIFGGMTGTSTVDEDSIPESEPLQHNGFDQVKTSCKYNLNNKTYTSVELQAQQNADPTSFSEPSYIFSDEPADLQKLITAYGQLGGGKEAKDLVATMNSSLAKLKKNSDSDADTSQVANGLVLPSTLSDTAIQFFHGNILYTLEAIPAGSHKKLTGAQLNDVARAITAINQQVAQPQLSQAPVGTILGTTDKVGSSKLIDACTVLTTANFKTITTVDENQPVSRITPKLNAQPSFNQSKQVIVAHSDCTRNNEYLNADGENAGGTYADFDLYFAASAAQAQLVVKQYADNPTSPARIALQTGADEAYVYPADPDDSSSTPQYLFRVGSYVGSITINMQGTSQDGSDTDNYGTQDQNVQAINILVQQLKSLQK